MVIDVKDHGTKRPDKSLETWISLSVWLEYPACRPNSDIFSLKIKKNKYNYK